MLTAESGGDWAFFERVENGITTGDLAFSMTSVAAYRVNWISMTNSHAIHSSPRKLKIYQDRICMIIAGYTHGGLKNCSNTTYMPRSISVIRKYFPALSRADSSPWSQALGAGRRKPCRGGPAGVAGRGEEVEKAKAGIRTLTLVDRWGAEDGEDIWMRAGRL